MTQSSAFSDFLTNKENKVLFLSLISVAFIIIAANFVERNTTIIIANLLYVPLTSFFAITAIALTIRTKEKQMKRFLFFLSLLAVFWFIAEQYWGILELVYNENPFPSIADVFFILGPASMLVGFGTVVFPRFKQISLDVKIIGTVTSVFLLIPSIMLTNSVSEFNDVERALSLLYVILDAGLIWFTAIILMELTTMKNKFVIYLALGILSFYVGDTFFSFTSISGTYYSGNPSDIFYYWCFVFLGFAAYTGLKRHAIIQLTDATPNTKKINLSSKYRAVLFIVAVVVMGLISILILNDFKITLLTPNEERLIIPMIYASLLFAIGSTLTNLIFLKKESAMESRAWQDSTEKTSSTSQEITAIERQISVLESRSKKNSILTILGIGVLACVIVTYVSLTVIRSGYDQVDLATGKFLIENLKGDKISTWVTWRIPQNQTLQVSLINSPGLSDQRINVIKDAIVSEKSIVLANSFMNKEPPNGKSTYYEGWVGALKTGSKQKTKFVMPVSFFVTTSTKSVGNIILILSTAKETDNTYGFTRTVADDKSHQILKSFITIYNVDNLNEAELSAVIRHEFGHALGLAHSTDSKDLMYPTFSSNQAVISECDIDAMVSLYNGKTSTDVVCRH